MTKRTELSFDIEFCGLPLWVKVKGGYRDWEIEEVEFYTGKKNITKAINWENAFQYDFFLNTVSDQADYEWENQ